MTNAVIADNYCARVDELTLLVTPPTMRKTTFLNVVANSATIYLPADHLQTIKVRQSDSAGNWGDLIGTAGGFVAWLICTWLVFLPMGKLGEPFINIGFWALPAFGLYQGIRWGRLTEYEPEPPGVALSADRSAGPDAR